MTIDLMPIATAIRDAVIEDDRPLGKNPTAWMPAARAAVDAALDLFCYPPDPIWDGAFDAARAVPPHVDGQIGHAQIRTAVTAIATLIRVEIARQP